MNYRNFFALVFILFITSISLSMKAQDKSGYDVLWKKVDSLYGKKGLTESALEEVNKIYDRAKKENNQPQLIKTLIFQAGLQQPTQENADVKSIQRFEEEIAKADQPLSKALLNSITAGLYYRYFQNNRWKFYNRTATENFKKDDLATWSLADFQQKISALYFESLKDEKKLQQTEIEDYEPLIIAGTVRYLRPTLYDLLANRALEYFSSAERYITKPSYAFEINEASAFDPAANFIHAKFETKDTASLHYKALLIYQKLIAFHLNDKKPDALIDVDLQRIQFVNNYAVHENKNELYYNVINHMAQQYGDMPAAAQAWYLLAQWHAGKASEYDPLNDTANRYEYVKAKEICEKILQQKEKSEGYHNCSGLLEQIKSSQINLATEKVNIPGKPFRTLVGYKNVPSLNFRVIQLTTEMKAQLEDKNDEDTFWKMVAGFKYVKNWKQQLPDTKDYQTHNVEIKVDALPVGEYILLGSVDEGFSRAKNLLVAQRFYVSNISYVSNDNDYFVLHRETGKPLESAAVQVWYSAYDYQKRKYIDKKGELLVTDKMGHFTFKYNRKRETRAFQLELKHKNDHLYVRDNSYIYYTYNDDEKPALSERQYEEENSRVFLFTDRSIYRPGQTIYFKGIAITKDFATKTNKVIADKKTTVALYNANHEVIDSIKLITNEYGSYSGKFKLPESMLNGYFRIKDEDINGETGFSVEEYKRPSFSVEYDTLKTAYKVNDSVLITGNAKAFAGNSIDGAEVKYRVVRVPRFLPWRFSRTIWPRTSEMEITNGVTKTDAEGKFYIRFKAIPDLQIKKALDPLFDYRVIADVTDNSGETRSGEMTVTVSYKAMQLQIALENDATLSVDSLKSIAVMAKNFNDQKTAARVHLQLCKLKHPGRLINKRYWRQPDLFVMSYNEYVKYFPNDEYSNESEKETWENEKIVATVDGNANEKIDIKTEKPETGWYKLIATATDTEGSEVKDIKYVLLENDKSDKLPIPEYLAVTQTRETLEPGERTKQTIASSAHDVTIIQQVSKRNVQTDKQVSTYNLLSLNNGKKSVDIAATEADRGGIGVNYFLVKNNRFYIRGSNVNVPWTNKELTISYETWRDKTLPGSEEKWTVKISGSKKEKVAAELLAGMYDASLDQFQYHKWNIPNVWPVNAMGGDWRSAICFEDVSSRRNYWSDGTRTFMDKRYDELISFENNRRLMYSMAGAAPVNLARAKGEVQNKVKQATSDEMFILADAGSKEMVQFAPPTVADSLDVASASQVSKPGEPSEQIQLRKNFNETAFFFPDLRTDADGNISFSFTMPEALTKWKFQALAHTKDLSFGYSTVNMITQKDLMVQPNAPRFLREGDKIEMSARIVNMTDKEITGTVQLELLNAATMQSVDGWFQNIQPVQYFTVAALQSAPVKFDVTIPYNYNSAIVYRFKAVAGNNSDGEEKSLPVLTNSMLVTESMPLNVRNTNSKNFKFDKLLQSGNSETLQQYALTVEYTSNPAWYAVQALPYLTDFPYECAEQTFNRYYANALAGMIANKAPRLKAIVQKWNSEDSSALLSSLQKNEELKSVLLEETPWVLQAKNEAQQKKNIALLFDMVRMNNGLQNAYERLKQLQSSNGGFVWFKGGPDNRYVTQYIASGIGHLKKLGALTGLKQSWNTIAKSAVDYLDERITDDYNELIKSKTDLKKNNLSYMAVQYLYMRSFYSDIEIPAKSATAIKYFTAQAKQYWLQQSVYSKAMIALALNRSGDKATANNILKSLKQNAVNNDELGMYWKDVRAGYFWYEAPIETQAVLIEAFSEIGNDVHTVNDLKTWLLKNKQTNNWKTTKATADACYALLLQGSDWLSATPTVEIKLGNKTISSTDNKTEAGTGYFKNTISGDFVKPEMGNISVKISGANTQITSWGSVYWQYFERLENITPAATPLQLTKKLFVEKNTDRGPVLTPVNANDVLKVGDKIKVRIELRVDRDMEFVHMKDMRASCMEPVNVISSYKWQGGLGYYETTKDAGTNFFFDYLRKGTYVFEYPLFVTHQGNFSNGITTIQCMYAPEFSSHSEGVRVTVE